MPVVRGCILGEASRERQAKGKCEVGCWCIRKQRSKEGATGKVRGLAIPKAEARWASDKACPRSPNRYGHWCCSGQITPQDLGSGVFKGGCILEGTCALGYCTPARGLEPPDHGCPDLSVMLVYCPKKLCLSGAAH